MSKNNDKEPSGTMHLSAALVVLNVAGNRLKLIWAAICPWKRDIRITISSAAIFINPPPK